MDTIHQAGFELVKHLLHLPDLASSNYRLFPKLKDNLRSKIFLNNNELMQAAEGWLLKIGNIYIFFQKTVELLDHR